jgi:uncharacterized membrane protein
MTAPAVVAWGAHFGRLKLAGTALAFMSSPWAVGFFTLGAVGESVADLLPKTPARTAPGPLLARLVMGALTGACVAAANGASIIAGAITGALGAIAGAYAGYHARRSLVRGLKAPDFAIAIPEDLVAVGLALLLILRF